MAENTLASETAAPKPKKGIGCGTMIAFLIILVLLVGLGGNEGFKYYIKHCGDEELSSCLMNRLEEPEPEGSVTATGTYTYKEYSAVLTMHIPLEGGTVTGNISGDCSGPIKGTFSGANNGVISGTITGACDPFLVAIPASATFKGAVNKDKKVVPITFSGKGAVITHDGSVSLSY